MPSDRHFAARTDGAGHIDAGTLNKLKWRSRRGMLENDLFIERFYARHGHTITARDAAALMQLMSLSENDLLDLFLGRTEPAGDLDTPEVRKVLGLLREPPQ